jgi:hypothetical protein
MGSHKPRPRVLLTPGTAVAVCSHTQTYLEPLLDLRELQGPILAIIDALSHLYHVAIDIRELMGNHYHLDIYARAQLPTDAEVIHYFNTRYKHQKRQLTPGDLRLPQVKGDMILVANLMRDLNSRIATLVNIFYGFTGHLWRKGYDCRLLDTDEYLINSAIYAELNPTRARLVDYPQDYFCSRLAKWLITPDPTCPPELWRLLRERRELTIDEYPLEEFILELNAAFERRLPGWRAVRIPGQPPRLVELPRGPGVPAWAA